MIGGVEMSVIPQNLSWVKCLGGSHDTAQLSLRLRTLTLTPTTTTTSTIRMGGGPRTYPGGVSKWQWKRMQAKKAKQLLKARLCRERQIYEMRKRAELRAAVSELEKPWEVVERAPKLFSVSADEQVKALADRFQKPGGFDMWSDRDGPQLFHPQHGLPSARFFPKGVVHSIKPYGVLSSQPPPSSSCDDDADVSGDAHTHTGSSSNNKVHPPRGRGNRPSYPAGRGRSEIPRDGSGIRIRGGRRRFPAKSSTEAEVPPPYEMSLRLDGRYEFRS